MAKDCVSKVELSISCSNLLDKDVGSKSDPLCVLLLQGTGGDKWTEVTSQSYGGLNIFDIDTYNIRFNKTLISLFQLGRTEKLNNTSSPSFSQRLRLDYHFEAVQNLKLGVYDIDNSSSDLKDDDYLGGVELTLGQVSTRSQYVYSFFTLCWFVCSLMANLWSSMLNGLRSHCKTHPWLIGSFG